MKARYEVERLKEQLKVFTRVNQRLKIDLSTSKNELQEIKPKYIKLVAHINEIKRNNFEMHESYKKQLMTKTNLFKGYKRDLAPVQKQFFLRLSKTWTTT